MRIAIQNTYYGKHFAEAELSRRLALAARNLGWEAVEVGTSEAINQCRPDFALNLHFRTPKLTCYPTYGCLWHPSVLIETDERFIRNVLSYDGYLSSSNHTNLWLTDRLYNTPKHYFIAPFFTSSNQTVYQAPNLHSPQLAYIGTNWDGARFKPLFLELEKKGILAAYGASSSWAYLNTAYKGSLPFDGLSVLTALNAAGVGLCLHREEHTQAGIPSMRIFEIVASGAIAICGEHSFIREQFADTVLYLNTNLSLIDQVAQIMEHLNWIANQPKVALEMSRAAHQIFSKKFTLENLLHNLQNEHQKLIETKYFIRHHSLSEQSSSVQLILRSSGKDQLKLEKTLNSIKQQTHQNLSVLIVQHQLMDGCSSILATHQTNFPIQIIQLNVASSQNVSSKSSELWAAIQSVSSDYFGVLDEGSIIYPNHVHTLVSLLDRFQYLGMAYSEVVELSEPNSDAGPFATSYEVDDVARLAIIQPLELFELFTFERFINLNSLLARSALIDEMLIRDPQLNCLEDVFLLLNLSVRGRAMFSYEVTCEIDSRNLDSNGLSKANSRMRDLAMNRIRLMMGDRDFPVMRSPFKLQSLQTQLQQTQAELQQAQLRIAAMESSKFWKLRKNWLRLKRAFGLTLSTGQKLAKHE
ncbi:MAG: hypothetical protein IGS48_02125 [Oscillatoriales cyanobacterium C42_A2020_001]|nr:hypothetical protein [Leptolyngbyaceae cyanobacterium C42_A2020_001]